MLDRNLVSIGISCCLLLFLLSDATCYGEFKKTKIAVLDFELRGDSFKTKDMGGIVAEWFTTTLVQDGRFEVVERALLQKIIEEQKLGMTGLIDESSSAEIGKILGVRTIITGSVLQFGETIEVNARIINVKSGSIVAAENIRSNSSDNLKEVIEILTTRIMKNFPLTGYVVRKKGEQVLIDLGAASGLQLGMKFFVFKEGEVIKHPKTGEVLEVEQIRTGLIQISDIRSNIATAEIVEEEFGNEILYGQLVQSVRKIEEPKESSDASTTRLRPAPGTAREISKPVRSTGFNEPEGYVRSEFQEGERDFLVSGGEGPALIPLKVGEFMMGSSRFSEKPVHFVKIARPVFLMTSEVTFDDFEKFCIETGHPFPDDSGWGKKDRPVINVSWHDAQAYAKWLSQQTGTTYRLPAETEWEWAAGAGTGTMYAWGNRFKKDLANCRKCGVLGEEKQTTPVRSFPPNKSGFFDMTGNVWEWVQDCWVENYVNAPEDQSPRKITGRCGNYTIRGGAWNSPKRQITVTSRLGIWAKTKSNYIGFRLVKEIQAPPTSGKSNLPGDITKQEKTAHKKKPDTERKPKKKKSQPTKSWPSFDK